MAPIVTYEPLNAVSFCREVMERSGQNLTACYQCRRCAAGCPVGEETGVTPDRLIRLVVMGEREEALSNLLTWQCVACYTCGTRCPNNIHTARVTETLKHMAKEAHAEPLVPKIANFHGAFIASTSHFGRVNEMEFMGIYEFRNAKNEIRQGAGIKGIIDELRNQARLGREMFRLKRIHIVGERVKNMGEVKRLFEKAGKGGDR